MSDQPRSVFLEAVRADMQAAMDEMRRNLRPATWQEETEALAAMLSGPSQEWHGFGEPPANFRAAFRGGGE